jgi:hypothetical protein
MNVEGRDFDLLLGAFVKLRKAAVSFFLSASLSVIFRLSVRMEHSAPLNGFS